MVCAVVVTIINIQLQWQVQRAIQQNDVWSNRWQHV